jgi:predicted nucleic acid binding AN1-type Zn finger protein
MLIKSVSSKYNDVEVDDNLNIYDIKLNISNICHIDISKVFLYNGDNLITNNLVNNISFKILNNACGVCLGRQALIIGDCKYCGCKFCSGHRLPETHFCYKLEKCRLDSREKNSQKLMAERLQQTKV